MNIAALLSRAGRVHGDRAAVHAGTRLVATYARLAERAARMAGGLRERHGLGAGDRVAIVMKNGPAYVEALFASWHAGLACVPVNAKLHAKEVGYILANSGARLVLSDPAMAALAGEAAAAADPAPDVLVAGSADYERLAASEPMALADTAPGDLAWLFYTSGTTGRPKGAMLSHRNLLAMSLGYLAEVDPTTPADCVLHPAPMSHGSGLYILPHVLAAAAQVVPESGGFDPDEIAGLLRHHKGASFFAAPTMVTRLVAAGTLGAAELANLRTIVYGGGPMYVEDARRALDAFGPRLAQIYGQGESPMTITVLPRHLLAAREDADAQARLASVGYAQAVVDVRVAGADDTALPAGEIGEILVRGDTVMSGYWRNPEASAETLRNGWLHTGDLGSMDTQGFLTLKDRSKDVIISGGTNIYPREVEEVLLLHEGVAEVAVIGRRHDDWGEEVIAVIAPTPGASVSPQELDDLCLHHVARFKRPKEYLFLAALPKNNYGKILKTELRSIVETGGAAQK